MRFKKFTGLLAFCTALMSAQTALAASCTTPSNGGAMLDAAAPLLERARRGGGGGRITRHADLDTAAQEQACWISRKGYNRSAPHNGAGGSTPMKRVKRAGYRSCLTAENLGLNQASAQQVVGDWMASSGHRANIILKGVREYGLGLALLDNKPVWVLVLAKPC